MLQTLLTLCDNCGCARYPCCNINGALCPDCMLDCRTHRDSSPLITFSPDVKTKFVEVPVEMNGDCLFSCVVRAFNNVISIEELRDAVARKQTSETFRAYKQLQKTEFPYMKPLSSLIEFQAFIRKRGHYFGAHQCYWGDENALEILSDNLKVRFAIYQPSEDDKTQCLRQFVVGHHNDDDIPYFIMLLHTEEHYTLLKWKPQNTSGWKTIAKGDPPSSFTLLQDDIEH